MNESYNIDKVLKPYEDSQPNRVPTNPATTVISRIPILVTEEGINPQFQEFYNGIVYAFTAFDIPRYDLLYEISDKVVDLASFNMICESIWGKHFNKFLSSKPEGRCIDIELNMSRFQELHRNLIGGFNIMTGYVETRGDLFGIDRKTPTSYLNLHHTEILFRYAENEFKVITQIKPFVSTEG